MPPNGAVSVGHLTFALQADEGGQLHANFVASSPRARRKAIRSKSLQFLGFEATGNRR